MALVLSGSIDISGSMTATTILVSSPGAAGMVSSSAQITELAPLMAYTASLKGAAIVSSSQQVQNYFTFARTGSVNTFFGNQGISGSLNVTNATGTNVIPQLTVTNTTTNGYGILRLVGKARGGIIDFYNTSSAQASIAADDGALQFYTNGDSTGTPKVIVTNDGYLRLAGAGIQFNGDTAAANSLDDYEEGTFTATVVGGTTAGTGTYSRQVGVYTKIGNLVTCHVWIQWSTHTGTGDLYFGGFPFTSTGTTNYRASGVIAYFENLTLTAGFIPGLVIVPSSTQASVGQNPVGGGAAGASAQIDTAANIHFSIAYQTT